MKNSLLPLVFCTLLGYLSGSIHYSRLLPMLICKKDPAALSDDKNPGAANAFKHAGVAVGMICVILDIAKGLLPAMLSLRVLGCESALTAVALSAPSVGHAYSVFYRFRGGKAIAVSFGVWIALVPFSTLGIYLALLLIFFSTVVVVLPHALRVMLCYSITLVLGWISEPLVCVRLTALFLTVIIYLKHLKGYIRGDEGNVSLCIFKKQVFSRDGK